MQYKYLLDEKDMPTHWYNILTDMKSPPPPYRHPATLELMGPDDLVPVFPLELIKQEASAEQYIEIPDEVQDILKMWRPSPVYRAHRWEKALDTPAKIYYKWEGVSPPGSHKPNTAVPQAYYNKVFGIERMTTETGAGQWGSALAFACSQFGLACKVFMVRISFDQKPYRKAMMETWGGECVASPSNETKAGQEALAKDPNTPGSLGIAISEAIEQAVGDSTGKTRYSLGSVLNHVMLHQTIIGLEAKKQLAMINEYPDIIIGCAGGGSNFAGLAFPFVLDKINGKQIEILPVEPMACPTLTKAPFVYDHGDTARYTPLLPMYSLGHDFVPAPIHAGGLRYHGMAPTVSQLVDEGILTPKSVVQSDCFKAGILWARTEGVIPAPETTNALAQVVIEANKAKEEGKEKVIVFNFSGHGLLDLAGYEKFLHGDLKDFALSEDELGKSMSVFADYPKPQHMKSF
jgi:tryptophan synthase beta chain